MGWEGLSYRHAAFRSAAIAFVVVVSACGRAGFQARDDVAASCTPIAGLLGYWTLDAADVVGRQVSDRSGHGADGTLVGTPLPALASGKIGDALDFTAVGASNAVYLQIPPLVFDATPGAAVTVAMWMYRPLLPTPNDGAIYIPTDPARYDLYFTETGLCINTGTSDCWGVIDSSLTDRWLHVAAVFVNGPSINDAIYIDGVARSLTCTSIAPCVTSRTAMGPLMIGGGDPLYQYYGKLDDIRVYNRALSDGEVQNVFDGSVCPP